MNCQNCGANVDGKAFCPQCGAQVQAPAQPSYNYNTGYNQPVIFSIIALKKANNYIATYGDIANQVRIGRRLAIAGLIVSIIFTIIYVLIFVAAIVAGTSSGNSSIRYSYSYNY